MKPGEREAKDILEKKGIVFNEEYYDDNSKNQCLILCIGMGDSWKLHIQSIIAQL